LGFHGGFSALRWWRRNEGFEWREYVKTTVLVRRRQRRAKIDAAKVAAVEGVKDAGRKGLAAGAAGAEAAGQAALKAARVAAEGAAGGAETGLALLVRSISAVRDRIAAVSGPINTRLAARPVSIALAITSLFSGTASLIRSAQFGLDQDAILLGSVAFVSLTAWLWPRLFTTGPDAADDWAVRTERAVAMAGRAQPYWPFAVASVAAVTGLWLATPLVKAWVAGDRALKEEPADEVAGEAGNVVEGPARAAGTGLLKIGRNFVRLEGIAMLDEGQKCLRHDGSSFECGATARRSLDRLLRSTRTVRCSLSGETDGIRTGQCSAGRLDIAARLVEQGFAFSDGGLFSSYATDEAAAKSSNAGLWAGLPEHPEEWRERVFREAAREAPGNCPIKALVQSGRKIYSLPHQPDYQRVTVREKRGDRWFCSEADAQREGFTARIAK
jgi:endonuclease YncB( thermonuclease family)